MNGIRHRIHEENVWFILTDGQRVELHEPQVGLVTSYPDFLERHEGSTAEEVLDKIFSQRPEKNDLGEYIVFGAGNIKAQRPQPENWFHTDEQFEQWKQFKKTNPKSQWKSWNI